jgi:hypothetical protein
LHGYNLYRGLIAKDARGKTNLFITRSSRDLIEKEATLSPSSSGDQIASASERKGPRRAAQEVEEIEGIYVTPIFPKKIKCVTICMPGSIFIHIVT